MIAIRFNPKFEDRVSIFFRQSKEFKRIEYSFEEDPFVFGSEKELCYWILKPIDNKQINAILSELKDMKCIMGIEDLMFSYCFSMKEYFRQYDDQSRNIPWFDV